jgi:hypothetical protein
VVDSYLLAANRNLLFVTALDGLAKDDLPAIDIINLDETPFVWRAGILDLATLCDCRAFGQQYRDD